MTDGMTDGWTDRRGSQNSYLDEQLLLVTFCHITAGNRAIFRTHRRNDGRTE